MPNKQALSSADVCRRRALAAARQRQWRSIEANRKAENDRRRAKGWAYDGPERSALWRKNNPVKAARLDIARKIGVPSHTVPESLAEARLLNIALRKAIRKALA